VIAAFFQFDHGFAIEAALPPFFLGRRNECLRCLVLRTFLTSVPLSVTERTYLGFTSSTASVLPAIINVHVTWPYPLAAATHWTVEAVLRSILLILLVPQKFELCAEESIYVLQGYVVGGTALGRHVCGSVTDMVKIRFRQE